MGSGQSHNSKEKLLFPRLFLDTSYFITNNSNSIDGKIRNFFSVEKLPIFCKIEHKMSMNARLPVKIRLGSIDYVDKMEGKNRP